MTTQPQVFYVPDRTIPSSYNREEDLETIYVAGIGAQKAIARQLLIDAETNKRNAELTLVGLATGEGFYANEVKVSG